MYFFYFPRDHRHLHSFPTRRSSDLSPKSMCVPLVALAILATVGGFVGISTAFTGGKEVGGRMNIVTWLNPVIWNPDRKSTRLNSSHMSISYAVFCLKKKKNVDI